MSRTLHASSEKPAIAFAVRFGLYLAAATLFFQLLVWLIPTLSRAEVVPEGHLLENFQVLCLGLAFAGLMSLILRRRAGRELHVVLAWLLVLAVVREHNNAAWYQQTLGAPWMRWVAVAVTLGLLGLLLRRNLIAQVRAFLARRSFLLFLLGAAMVVGWAQVLSQSEIWSKEADRLVEEALEAAGYLFILCGVIEETVAG